MANIMICSTGTWTELYIDSNRVTQGVEKVSFTAEAGRPVKMELVVDVGALKIETDHQAERDTVQSYMLEIEHIKKQQREKCE